MANYFSEKKKHPQKFQVYREMSDFELAPLLALLIGSKLQRFHDRRYSSAAWGRGFKMCVFPITKQTK